MRFNGMFAVDRVRLLLATATTVKWSWRGTGRRSCVDDAQPSPRVSPVVDDLHESEAGPIRHVLDGETSCRARPTQPGAANVSPVSVSSRTVEDAPHWSRSNDRSTISIRRIDLNRPFPEIGVAMSSGNLVSGLTVGVPGSGELQAAVIHRTRTECRVDVSARCRCGGRCRPRVPCAP